jgi:hypothetical protein
MLKKKAAKKVQDSDRINEIRNLPGIKALWEKADAKGRCWGPRRKADNGLGGSHINIFLGEEMVSIVFDKKSGRPVIFEYDETCGTRLGKEVFKALFEGGFAARFNMGR